MTLPGGLPAAGVRLEAQNLEQFKQQVREANDAIRGIGKEGKEAKSGLQEMRDQMTRVITVAGGLTAGLYTLNKMYDSTVGRFVSYARSIRDISQATGENAESVSRLLQLGDDFQVSEGNILGAMRAMRDKGLVPSIDTLARLSDEFLALEPGAERTNFLFDRLGRSGVAFADMLAQGSDAIRERAAATSESLILSEQDLASAQELEWALDALTDASNGVAISLGRRLVPALTRAAQAAELLLTQDELLQGVLEDHDQQMVESIGTYQDYIKEMVRAAVVAGLLEKMGRGEIATFYQTGVLTENMIRQLNAMGIATTEAEWASRRAVATHQESAVAMDDYADRARAAAVAARSFGEAEGYVAQQAIDMHGAFGYAQVGISGMIDSFRQQREWIAGGGLGLQAAYGAAQQQYLQGVLPEDEWVDLEQRFTAASLSLETSIGAIEMPDAIRQYADAYETTWDEARTAIRGARDDILTLPTDVRAQIAVAVRWYITGGGGEGFQHGGAGVVPPGFPGDSYPIFLTSGEHYVVSPPSVFGGAVSTVYDNSDHRSVSVGTMGGGAGPDMSNPYVRDRVMRGWLGG